MRIFHPTHHTQRSNNGTHMISSLIKLATKPQTQVNPNLNKELMDQITTAHQRIDMCIGRIEHLEHYNGLRYHEFEKQDKERLWDFNQSLKDTQRKQRPRSVEEIRRAARNKAKRAA